MARFPDKLANQITVRCHRCEYRFIYGYDAGMRRAPETCPRCDGPIVEPAEPVQQKTAEQRLAEMEARLAQAEANARAAAQPDELAEKKAKAD